MINLHKHAVVFDSTDVMVITNTLCNYIDYEDENNRSPICSFRGRAFAGHRFFGSGRHLRYISSGYVSADWGRNLH